MKNDFQFLLYHSAMENVTVQAVIRDETIWLTQKAMAELFGVGTPAISKHLQNIYDEGELSRDATVSKMETVQTDRYNILPDKGEVSRRMALRKPKRNTLRSIKHSLSFRISTGR